MTYTDPIGDMITRIRNAQNAGKEKTLTPASSLRENVLSVLKAEGFISNFRRIKGENNKDVFEIELKYIEGRGAIQEISRVSKPGRRVYSKSAKMPRVLNGLGISIVSTPKGVMADYQARLENLGGEILCRVV